MGIGYSTVPTVQSAFVVFICYARLFSVLHFTNLGFLAEISSEPNAPNRIGSLLVGFSRHTAATILVTQ